MLAFLEGALAPAVRSAAEKHIAACRACADLVTWAAADQGSSTMGLPGREGRPFVGQLQPEARISRYQILGALGRGGMGEVYAAYHPDLDRRIAIKVVHSFGADARESRVRLLREARAIARLSHPNVVTVHDAGTFGDRVFIAMELIDGQTVDRWLRAQPRRWQEVLDVFVAAGRGIEAAHAAGVVHRDFKPQNVMIRKDGAVRVMDFGLARLAHEAADPPRTSPHDELTVPLDLVTKTGAFIGTPAYMSPEQLRREATDARSDQFSFCVALHEALFGTRPATAAADDGSPTSSAVSPSRRAGVPGWLRSIVRRGASVEREHRYGSMGALLAALERGRTRTRRRASLAAAALAIVLVSAGAWRVAHANRFACVVPQDRVAAAWSLDSQDLRRKRIHDAFAASGRASAETSWTRVSKVLDDYMHAWSAMYVETCEATHVRGEQSAEVLDLRMSCLNDNLDQVRALSDALATANGNALSHAVAAAQQLTPISRCTDVPTLRSAVPLPRDERTLHEVQRLRRALKDVDTLYDLGDTIAALKRASALRAEVEATAYKPLLGELLRLIGTARSSIDEDATNSEATLREAMVVAAASKDDVTAAQVIANLIYVVGYRLGRLQEAEFWAKLGLAMLDRVGGEQERTRSWVLGNMAGARARGGDFEGARLLCEESVRLRQRSVGAEHPDTATSLSDLAYVLATSGHPREAIVAANHAIEIFQEQSDPESYELGFTYSNQGDALVGLGRYGDAEAAYERGLQILRENVGPMHPEIAFALHGLGEAKLALGAPTAAIRLFEDALRIRRQPQSDPVLAADTQFGLARALWDSGDDRTRARALATAARVSYTAAGRAARQEAVERWLENHYARRSRSRDGWL